LTPAQKLAVMDKLIACEAMWLDGTSLSQSLLTCLYLHKESSAQLATCPILSAFVHLLLRRCQEIRQNILKADIYQEEDFSRSLPNWSFWLEWEEDVVLKKSTEVEELLAKKASENAEEAEVWQAILSRVRFSRSWYKTQLDFREKDLNAFVASIQATEAELAKMKSSREGLGDDTVENLVFEYDIMKRIEVATHLRKIKIIDSSLAIGIFKSATEGLLLAHTVHQVTKLSDVKDLLLHLVSSGAGLLGRSYYILWCFSEDKFLGKSPIVEWLHQDARDCANIPDAYLKLDFVQPFLDNMARCYALLIQICSWNKARMRRGLPDMFREFSMLSDEASRVDVALAKHLKLQEERTAFFVLWVLDKTHWCMIYYLQLGFDLDLYYEEEYHVIFWYMDTLCFNRRHHHQYLLKFAENHKNGMKANTNKGNKPKGNKRKPPKQKQVKDIVPTPYHLEICAQFELSRAMLRYMAALKKANKLVVPEYKFGSAEHRYRTRFEDFGHIMFPAQLKYEQYLNDVKEANKNPAEGLFTSASETFKSSRSIIENLLSHPKGVSKFRHPHYLALKKIAIMNSVQIEMIKLKKIHTNPASKVNWNFDTVSCIPGVTLVVPPPQQNQK